MYKLKFASTIILHRPQSYMHNIIQISPPEIFILSCQMQYDINAHVYEQDQ